MAKPNIVKIDPPLSYQITDDFLFIVWVQEDGDPEPFNAAVSPAQASVAGFDPEHGPTVEWLRERFLEVASRRLANDRSVIEQMNEWQMPVVIGAE